MIRTRACRPTQIDSFNFSPDLNRRHRPSFAMPFLSKKDTLVITVKTRRYRSFLHASSMPNPYVVLTLLSSYCHKETVAFGFAAPTAYD